jgi:tetratricopeptide (TPR) repeat protein
MSEKELCDRDLSVLNLIFDQKKCETEVKSIVKPVNDDVEVIDEDEGRSDEIVTSKDLEVEGVELTEAGKLEEALENFNKAIEVAPKRPSPYNNRAQLYRFLENDARK